MEIEKPEIVNCVDGIAPPRELMDEAKQQAVSRLVNLHPDELKEIRDELEKDIFLEWFKKVAVFYDEPKNRLNAHYSNLLEKCNWNGLDFETEIKKTTRKAVGNTQFYKENLARLREEYGGNQVAIKNQEIIASAERYKELAGKLEDQDIDPRDVLIIYIWEHR